MPNKKDVTDELHRLERASIEAEAKGSGSHIETARSVLAAVRCAEERLKIVEDEAVRQKHWEDIEQSIKWSRQMVTGAGGFSHYGSSGEVDEFLFKIQSLPVRTTGAQQQIAADILSQIRRETKALVNDLKVLAESQRSQVAELEKQAQQALNTNESQTRVATQLKKEAEAAEKRRTETLNEQLTTHQKQTSLLSARAREELDAEMVRQREALERLTQEVKQSGNEITQQAQETTQTVLDQLQAHLAQAEKIVGVVSRTVLAGSYSEAAERERQDAITWRRIAAGAMLGIIIIAVFSLVHSLVDGFSAAAFTAKIVTSFAFMILAAYAGRESARHRRIERHARRMHLELATIDSYLLSLPEEQRHAIKAAVAGRIFGQPLEAEQSDKSEAAGPPLLEYLKLASAAAK